MMLTRDDAQKLAKKILGFSRSPECTANITATEQAYVRFANNGITLSGFSHERSVIVASTREGKTGGGRMGVSEPKVSA